MRISDVHVDQLHAEGLNTLCSLLSTVAGNILEKRLQDFVNFRNPCLYKGALEMKTPPDTHTCMNIYMHIHVHVYEVKDPWSSSTVLLLSIQTET